MRRLLSQIAVYGLTALAALGALAAGLHGVLALGAVMVTFIPLTLLADRWFPAQAPPASRALRQKSELRRNIALLLLNLTFCAIGVAIVGRDWRVSAVTIALFGGGTIVFLDIVLRQLRERRLQSQGIESVGVIGGVDIPLARGRVLAMGFGLTATGSIAYAASVEYPWAFRITALFIAATGIALLAALPFTRRRRLRFDPQGLLIGHWRFEFRIEWDSIRAIGLVELASNPFVTLQLADIEHITVEPPSRRAALLKLVASTRAWYGADVVIPALHFGLQAPLLAAAIARCTQDPDARRELADRLLQRA